MPPKTHPFQKTAGAKKAPTIKTGIKKTFAQKTLHLNSAGSSKKKSCSVCKEDPCSCKKTSKKVGATKKAVVKKILGVANEHYKVKKEDSLEAILLALHLPGDQVDFLITDFSSNVLTVTPGEVGP